MSKTKKIGLTVLTISLALIVAFIFLQSVPGQEASSQESSRIMEIVKPFLELFVGKGNVTHHLVRKLAHLFEFTVLGFETGLIVFILRKRKAVYGVLFGLLVALSDETIQIFTGRGPQVQDVWLDFSGVCLGMVCAAVVVAVFNAIIIKKKK